VNITVRVPFSLLIWLKLCLNLTHCQQIAALQYYILLEQDGCVQVPPKSPEGRYPAHTNIYKSII
jgi:hypothetical protein